MPFIDIEKRRQYHRERMRRLRNAKYLGYTTANVTIKKEQQMTMTLSNGEVIILKKRLVGSFGSPGYVLSGNLF